MWKDIHLKKTQNDLAVSKIEEIALPKILILLDEYHTKVIF